MGTAIPSNVDWTSIVDAELGSLKVSQLPSELHLPALPHAVTMFIRKSEDPNISIRELGAIVETDTGLTLELLRYINSTIVGLRTKVGSAQQAIALLGLRPARSFIISTGMRAVVQAKQSKLLNQQCFWNATFQKALFARQVAVMLRADPETAFAGALLQDFLLPVITNELFEDYLEYLQQREQQPVLMTDFEHGKLGWNHAMAGACLARRWHLPDDLVACILYHHHGLHTLADPRLARTAVAAVAISALLPDQLRQCFTGLEQLMLLQKSWPSFQLQTLTTEVDRLHEELGMGVSNDFPLARRCRMAFPTAADGTSAVPAAAAVGPVPVSSPESKPGSDRGSVSTATDSVNDACDFATVGNDANLGTDADCSDGSLSRAAQERLRSVAVC